MNQKLSLPVVVAIVAFAVVAIVGSVMYYRNVSGADAVDQMHAAMSKVKPGQSPFTKEQMDEMNKRGKGPGGMSPSAPH